MCLNLERIPINAVLDYGVDVGPRVQGKFYLLVLAYVQFYEVCWLTGGCAVGGLGGFCHYLHFLGYLCVKYG